MSTKEASAQTDGTEHLRRVRQTDLPPRVEALAEEYDRYFEERDRFLWQWIHSLFPAFTLSCVDDEYAEHVRAQKTILTMYVTILDDLVENRGDLATFREACRLTEDGVNVDPSRAAVDAETFAFIERVWTAFEDGLANAPRREEFDDVFAYDLRQTTNAVEYSAVLNDNPNLANLAGARRYDSHNMVMFAYADVDLMYSGGFEREEFGAVRDLLWDLQELARIGNWVTTWEREIAEEDFTAGPVVLAIERGIVTPEEVEAASDRSEIVARVREHGLEQRFRDEWESRYRAIERREFATDSVDLDRLVDGMETVYEYHLASEGLK